MYGMFDCRDSDDRRTCKNYSDIGYFIYYNVVVDYDMVGEVRGLGHINFNIMEIFLNV